MTGTTRPSPSSLTVRPYPPLCRPGGGLPWGKLGLSGGIDHRLLAGSSGMEDRPNHLRSLVRGFHTRNIAGFRGDGAVCKLWVCHRRSAAPWDRPSLAAGDQRKPGNHGGAPAHGRAETASSAPISAFGFMRSSERLETQGFFHAFGGFYRTDSRKLGAALQSLNPEFPSNPPLRGVGIRP